MDDPNSAGLSLSGCIGPESGKAQNPVAAQTIAS